jgi:acyl-CoA reductase-like NAD-dependent aldehyde dehydrogenase
MRASRATKCSARCWRCRSTTAHAIALANATDYGLVAGVWTRDGGRQLRMARAVHSGQVFVNSYGAGGGIELPFGGVKAFGTRARKGFGGVVRLHDAEDRRAAP